MVDPHKVQEWLTLALSLANCFVGSVGQLVEVMHIPFGMYEQQVHQGVQNILLESFVDWTLCASAISVISVLCQIALDTGSSIYSPIIQELRFHSTCLLNQR